MYHAQLTYCVVQFLEKDPSLTKEASELGDLGLGYLYIILE